MTNENMNIEAEFARAAANLNQTREAWVWFMARDNAEMPEDVRAFVLRVFAYRADSERGHWLWEVFHEVLDMSDLMFLDSFLEFVGHDLLDDGAFRIEWRKFGKELTTKDDPNAEPVVVRDYDEGTQDVALLMEALDHKQLEHDRRVRADARLNVLLARLRKP